MNYIGTKGEVCWQLKIFYLPHPPRVVYATDRSNAVVPVLFLILCSFVVYTTGRLMFQHPVLEKTMKNRPQARLTDSLYTWYTERRWLVIFETA